MSLLAALLIRCVPPMLEQLHDWIGLADLEADAYTFGRHYGLWLSEHFSYINEDMTAAMFRTNVIHGRWWLFLFPWVVNHARRIHHDTAMGFFYGDQELRFYPVESSLWDKPSFAHRIEVPTRLDIKAYKWCRENIAGKWVIYKRDIWIKDRQDYVIAKIACPIKEISLEY